MLNHQQRNYVYVVVYDLYHMCKLSAIILDVMKGLEQVQSIILTTGYHTGINQLRF